MCPLITIDENPQQKVELAILLTAPHRATKISLKRRVVLNSDTARRVLLQKTG